MHTFLGWGWMLLPALLLLLPALMLQIRFGINHENLSLWLTALSGHILSAGLIQQLAPLWINNKHFLLKIRLPVLFLPVSRLIVLLPEWALYSFVLIGLGMYSGLSVEFVFLQWLVVQLFVIFGFSAGLILCALSGRLRDVLHAVPVLIQGQLLIVVLYLLKGEDLGILTWLEWLPPVSFIRIVKDSEGTVLVALSTLVLFLFSAFAYVKVSKNALERI